jgi:hypothetical protein
MSSLSKEQQSVAGGFFQMTTRLVSVIGMGVTTAIFDGVQQHPATSGIHAGDPAEPYAATFWCAMGACALSVLFVPFLTIGTQGHGAGNREDVEGGGNGKGEDVGVEKEVDEKI